MEEVSPSETLLTLLAMEFIFVPTHLAQRFLELHEVADNCR